MATIVAGVVRASRQKPTHCVVYDGLCWIHHRFQWQTQLTQDAGWCRLLLAIHLVWECLGFRWFEFGSATQSWHERIWKGMKKSRQVSIRCFCEIPVGPTSAYSVICQFVVWINSIRSVSKGVYRIELRCGKVTLDVRSRDGLEKARDS